MGAGFGSFVDGLFAGAKGMGDLRKQADDLKAQMMGNKLIQQGANTALGLGNQPSTALPGGTSQPGFGGGTTGTGGTGTDGTGGPSTVEGSPVVTPDSGGSGDNPSAGQLYDYFIGTGATANEAALLTAQANVESSFNANATHDGGIGYGLWGHNSDRLSNMYSYAGLPANSAPGTKVPWQQQADFALNELRNRPEGAQVNAATTPAQLTSLGMAYERPAGYTAQNPQAGMNWDQRLAATTNYMQTPPHYIPPQQPTQTAAATPPTTALQPTGQTVEGSPVVSPSVYNLNQPPQPASAGANDATNQPAAAIMPGHGGVIGNATPTTPPGPGSAQTSDVNWNPYGDSIAMGFIESGYPGTYAASNGAVNTSQNAVGGRNPQQVLDRLNAIPTGSLKGAPVMISSGASNVGGAAGNGLDDQHLALIDQQVKSAKRAGAGRIMLLGVGDHGGREGNGGPYFDLHNMNPQLQKIATDNGVEFSGPLKGAVVHPGGSYYRSRFRQN